VGVQLPATEDLLSRRSGLDAASAAHSVAVAVTEFGAHRTASSASTYLQDRIELQNGIGNWAAWVWQPARFNDPFSLHDASSAHDVLATAWTSNCH